MDFSNLNVIIYILVPSWFIEVHLGSVMFVFVARFFILFPFSLLWAWSIVNMGLLIAARSYGM